MKKIKLPLGKIREEILNFYDEKSWHFMTINGVMLEDTRIEVQWMFSKYKSLDEIVIFYAEIEQSEIIPSIVDIIPSAIISQRELVDMFGVEVEGSSKGLYLDEDSLQMPLNSCSMKR